MAVTAHWYGKAAANVLGGETAGESIAVDWLSDTIKVAVLDPTHTPNLDTHEFFADVNGDEVAGTGYTAGGQALAGKTVTYDSATNTVKYDANDTNWPTSTITGRYAVVYKDTGSAATSPLLGHIDFGADQESVAGDFTITWDTDGVLEAVAA